MNGWMAEALACLQVQAWDDSDDGAEQIEV